MIGRRSHDDAQSFEEAWNGAAPRDEHIAELVAFAENLCEAAAAEPTAQFRSGLRARLMTEAATVLVRTPADGRPAATPTRQAPAIRRRLAGLTAALVASAGAVSLVASSASAVPGDLLYPIKRTVESVELNLHRSDSSRGAYQLGQATERLQEARRLTDQGAPDDLIAEALDDFSAAADDGSSRLFADFTDNGAEESVRKVNDFATKAGADLSELSTVLPDSLRDAFTMATQSVSRLAAEASSLCTACAPADVQSLVSSVTRLAARGAVPTGTQPVEKKEPSGSKQDPPAGAPSTADAPATSRPAKAPAPQLPVPSVPTSSPSVSDVTDPLLGGLLGDDEQEGLVPGLLNGLLGSG